MQLDCETFTAAMEVKHMKHNAGILYNVKNRNIFTVPAIPHTRVLYRILYWA